MVEDQREHIVGADVGSAALGREAQVPLDTVDIVGTHRRLDELGLNHDLRHGPVVLGQELGNPIQSLRDVVDNHQACPVRAAGIRDAPVADVHVPYRREHLRQDLHDVHGLRVVQLEHAHPGLAEHLLLFGLDHDDACFVLDHVAQARLQQRVQTHAQRHVAQTDGDDRLHVLRRQQVQFELAGDHPQYVGQVRLLDVERQPLAGKRVLVHQNRGR